MFVRNKVTRFLCAGVMVCVGVGSLVSAPVAAAANKCGSGYALVRDGYVPVTTNTGARAGVIEVYYSAKEKRNCAVLVKEGTNWGKSQDTEVTIEITEDPYGDTFEADRGNYKYYAGPVYTPKGISTAGKAITVYGDIAVYPDWFAVGERTGWDG